MGFYLGIDVGGTFTDGVLVDEEGRPHIFKTPSIPENPSLGLMNCLRKAADSRGLSLEAFLRQVEKLTYGTTIATNLLIEGKGAITGLITSKGFKDTLPIARIGREYLGIDLQCERPPPLTPRSLIEEVSERVDYMGRVITPLSRQDLEAAIERLLSKGVEAIAVCFLWSFKNPVHEEIVEEELNHCCPQVYLSLSSKIAPIIGEYERTATVTMNGSLGPPIKAHLGALKEQLETQGLGVPLLIMQSTGGVTPAEDASQKPVTLVNSGPAGGVIASQYLSQLIGRQNLICIDMGGTSFDASLLSNGQSSASLVSRALGHNILVPMLDIHSIGAGGGSVAWLDMGRRLKVGPQSAGADPGPACYGKGGSEPTVTDADVVLGRINPDYFLGGEMPIDAGKAQEAIAEKIARPLGMEVLEAAWGICQIVDASMAGALRVITVQKGHDPREYAMIAFGGAGPTHASALARELGVKTIVVPYLATVQSAFGIVASDIVHSFSTSDVMELDDPEPINGHFVRLEAQGLELLRREGIPAGEREVRRYLDMRYKGQAHQVTVTVPSGTLDASHLAQVVRDFEAKYETFYGRGTAYPEAGFEGVTLRVELVGRTRKPILREGPLEGPDPAAAFKGRRDVFFGKETGSLRTPIYDGDRLLAGNQIQGPAIVEYRGTTAVIHPGQQAGVDRYLNLIISEG